MSNAHNRVRWSAGVKLAALALMFTGTTARAQQANYQLPKEAVPVGNTFYYPVPIGFTWDHFSYIPNPGDWNLAIGDTGFDAGEIPGNPTFCGPKGDQCTADAGTNKSTSFITINNDALHGYSSIPLQIGPTEAGFNNAQIGFGQSFPVVPGKYKALYVTYTAVCGPQTKMLALNYTDATTLSSVKWADWCAPGQAPPDFFTWAPFHRLNATGIDNASCALITKYIPVDPNRTLTSVTIGMDGNGNNGVEVPGDTVLANCNRLVIGGMTLASSDANLGGYGFVSGHVQDSTGKVLTTPAHAATPDTGAEVFVLSPALGNYGAGVNVDGSYTIGLPAGTYTLSAAVRGGADSPTSAGPQAAPVTVTVEAGKTATTDIKLLAAPDPKIWGELTGTVKDASGNPVKGAAVLVSENETGPFSAVGTTSDYSGTPDFQTTGDGTTLSNGQFRLRALDASHPLYVMAAGNGFASASPVKATLTPGGTASQDITVAARAVGNIVGTLVTPEGDFGGVGIPVTLSSKDLTLTTATIALPPLASTNRVPNDGSVTSSFEFNGVPAGDYVLSLPASSASAAVSMPVTVTAGGIANPKLTTTYPAWSEGTADAKISDALTGAALDAKWTAGDIGAPTNAGSAKAGSAGLVVTADGGGWDLNGADDMFYLLSQPIPNGDFVAYVTVTQAPSTGMAGLMVSSSRDNAPRMANFTASVTASAGIDAEGRNADGTVTYPFGETAAGTTDNPPAAPIMLKLRKVGGSIAGFFSADGGKTQKFIGALTPQFDPAGNLLLGLAATSSSDGSPDTMTFRDFVYAPLAAAPPTAGQ